MLYRIEFVTDSGTIFTDAFDGTSPENVILNILRSGKVSSGTFIVYIINKDGNGWVFYVTGKNNEFSIRKDKKILLSRVDTQYIFTKVKKISEVFT